MTASPPASGFTKSPDPLALCARSSLQSTGATVTFHVRGDELLLKGATASLACHSINDATLGWRATAHRGPYDRTIACR